MTAAPAAAAPLAAPEKVAGGMPAGEVRITIPVEAPTPPAPTATESIVIIFGFRMAFVHKSLTL